MHLLLQKHQNNLTKTENHLLSVLMSASIEVVLYVRLFPLPIERNLKPKRDHSVSGVGTEELAHLEMIGAIVHQLTRNLTEEEIKKAGFDAYFVDHTTAVYPAAASGMPFTAAYLQSKGDVITDMTENLAAEQKARTTYDNILRLVDDPDVREPIKFLRAREIVHFQRFGEGLRLATDKLNEKNFYAFNPSFDKHCNK